MNYVRKVLRNGLRLITIPMPSFESATVLLLVKAGSRYETKKNNGISHFLEHMAFKGTKKRPSAMAISSIVDGIGGEFNAFTGKESTGYYIKSAAANLTLSMDVLSDMLQNSLLDAAEIEKEKGVVSEELNLYEDTPTRKIGDIYERLLYGDTPMGWDIGGEKKFIQSIKRADFVSYMNSLYSADNMTVVVVGGVTQAQVDDLAQKYFGSLDQFPTISYEKVIENQKRPEVLVKKKKTEQVHIALGFRTVPVDHPDRYPLSLLSSILGGGMSSRLFIEVRERGLAYYIRTVSDHYEDSGNLVSFAGVDGRRVEEAIKVIKNEYEKILSQHKVIALKEEELKKAKEYLKGHFVLDLEDSHSVADFYAVQELLEKHIDNPEDVIDKIDRVTLEEVKKVAKKYIKPQRLNLAVIGNFEDEERFRKLLSV